MERDTSQRRAIRSVIQQAHGPLTPNEILDTARRSVPNLGIATVYRSVKGFIEEGWLAPVDVPGEPQRYEMADKGHHHHFSCDACGRMYDFHGCPPNIEKLVPAGFELGRHELFLYGRCPDCIRRKRKAAK